MKHSVRCRKLKGVKISIIVPAFNEERLLGESLAQIKAVAGAFARRGWETELIVCDNNSNDRTAEIARDAGALVVFEPVNQIAAPIIAARQRPPATGWFLWMQIRIPAPNFLGKSQKKFNPVAA